jgi:hypothetical protein
MTADLRDILKGTALWLPTFNFIVRKNLLSLVV